METQINKEDLNDRLKVLREFDLTELLDVFSDEPQELVELLLGFKSRHESFFDEIKLSLEKKNIPHAKELTHKLKGTAGNIGAVALAKAATDLDNELRQNYFQQDTLLRLKDAFHSTMSSLSSLPT